MPGVRPEIKQKKFLGSVPIKTVLINYALKNTLGTFVLEIFFLNFYCEQINDLLVSEMK